MAKTLRWDGSQTGSDIYTLNMTVMICFQEIYIFCDKNKPSCAQVDSKISSNLNKNDTTCVLTKSIFIFLFVIVILPFKSLLVSII